MMMKRRDALKTFSAAVAGTALLALPRQAARAQAAPAGTAVAGSKLTMVQYKKFSLLGGSFAKQTSQLALTQGTNPKVREFAQFEISEQTTLAQVLTDMNNPPVAPLDAGHAAKLRELQGQSGKGFDVAYVAGQIAGHQELLSIQQGYLDNMPADLDSKHAAMLARTSIMMHITMLKDIQALLA